MGWRRFAYLLAVAGCAAFYVFYRMWLAGLLMAAVLALPWFSLLVSLAAILTTRVELPLPSHVQQGSAVTARIQPASILPTPALRCRVEVRNVMTGEDWDLKPGAPLPTNHCGQLEIRVRGCRVHDYLGLFRFPVRKCPRTVMLVRPKPTPLPQMPDLSRLVNRAWRPKRGGGFGENHELRLYRPGDSLQQLHWKLTAKTGKLILRETMEPLRGKILVKLDLDGTDEELDRKLGRALWLGKLLLSRELSHTLQALTGAGVYSFPIDSEETLQKAVDTLLGCPIAESGSIEAPDPTATWEYYIGGGDDEA